MSAAGTDDLAERAGSTTADLPPGLPLPPDWFTWGVAAAIIAGGLLLLAGSASGAIAMPLNGAAAGALVLFLFAIPFVHDAARPDAKSWASMMPSKPTPMGSSPSSNMGRNASNRAVIYIQGLPPSAVNRMLQTYDPALSSKSPQKRITAANMIASVGLSLTPEQRAQARRRLEPLRADPYEDVRRAAASAIERLGAATGPAVAPAAGGPVRIAIAGPAGPPNINVSQMLQNTGAAGGRLIVKSKSGQVEEANLRALSPEHAASALRAAASAASEQAAARRLMAVRLYGEMAQGTNAEARAASLSALEMLAEDADRKVKKAASAALDGVRKGGVQTAAAEGSASPLPSSLHVASIAPDEPEGR